MTYTTTSPALDESLCWQAIQTRDAAFDGRFFYGVATTGVFCRPACSSRQPRRENVVFFASRDEAHRAGYRACQRCRPDAATPLAELVEKVCRYLEENRETPVSLDELGAEFGVSPAHLQRMFKAALGVTPRQYAEKLRLEAFKTEVRQGRPVTDALYEAGYGSSSRLYEKSGAQLGMTPAVYRRGGAGMHIVYAVAACPLGRLLVAATERGICAVTLGDEDAELRKNLHAEFPSADIKTDATPALREWTEKIVRHLEGRQPRLDLPLDVQSTAFQQRVWDELRRIPYGQTTTYNQIAARLGQPTATRAVARACATNPAALVTPCHRVVGADGALTGYRWGVERKRELLAREKASV
jgi:AraC family transcriptional regulator of adaptative response/methylated-DNA-[protein]-cysteine methyltransferase